MCEFKRFELKLSLNTSYFVSTSEEVMAAEGAGKPQWVNQAFVPFLFVKLHSLVHDFLIALLVNYFVSHSHMFCRIFNG